VFILSFLTPVCQFSSFPYVIFPLCSFVLYLLFLELFIFQFYMSLSINFPSGFLPSVLGLCATLLAYFVSPVSSSLLNYSLLLFLSFSLSFHRNFAISFVSSVSCTCGSINSASLVTSYDRDVSAVSTLQGVQTRCLLFHVSLQFANFRPSPMSFFPSVPFFLYFLFLELFIF